MASDVKSERLLFVGKQQAFSPLWNIRQHRVSLRRTIVQDGRAHAEESLLSGFEVSLHLLSSLDGLSDNAKQLRAPMTQRIERSGFDKAFDHAFVDEA